MTIAERSYKVIGSRPIRPDGIEKVTGKAQYGADIQLPRLAYGHIIRSPHAHARILSIDTSEAEKMPGFLAVVTNKDLPGSIDKVEELGESTINLKELCEVLLADKKALYRGHAIAAVAATSRQNAEEIAKKVKIEYEVLPPVLNVRDAMREDAPLLKEDRMTKSMVGVASDKPSNIATHMRFEVGNVDEAWAECDKIVEREFTTTMVHQGYIEPHSSTASWNSDGTVTIWTSTQGSFAVRSQVANVLLLPVSQVRVIPLEIGGGFGGKLVSYFDATAAVLSQKAGRPIKITMSRADVFEATGPTSGTYIKVKAGIKGDRIHAVEGHLAYEAGAYPGASVGAGCMTMMASYDIPNARLDGFDVVVNKPKTAAYRAPGAPAATFAFEQVVDELARSLDMDPMAFRIANVVSEGSRMITGAIHARIGAKETMEAIATSDHYTSPIEGPNRGRGVANGFWFNGGMQSTVAASVNPDGTVNLIEGNTDIGGSRAALAMQLAETLGIEYERVHPTVVDTDSIGHNDVTGGSRITFASGQAVHEAGLDIRRQLVSRASMMLNVPEEDLEYVDGAVTAKSDPAKSLTFKQIAAASGQTGGPLYGKGTSAGKGVGAAFGTHCVDVEVDTDTGKVTILRYTAAQDVGTAIHPSYVEGQIQGACAQGIGWALNEEYFYNDKGQMVNSSYLDYRVPTTLDVPNLETILIEVPNPGHPFGVRGVGEVCIVPPLAAIANAIHDATGHRFTELPMSPRQLVETLNNL